VTAPVAPPKAAAPHVVVVNLPKAPRPTARMRLAGLSAPRPKLATTTMTYRVRSGDSLSSIASRELGSASRWAELYAANREQLTDPHWLKVGLILSIPTEAQLAGSGRVYVVQPGDNLSKIAQRELGDFSKWRQIYAANRGAIADPWYIFPGQRLVLPGTSVAAGPKPDIAWATLKATEYPLG
jgi:nucleoid-associated protein YgaU